VRDKRFHFTRAWLRDEGTLVADPRSPAAQLGRQLNLPPTYMLIHRVTLGGVGVLCQLGAEGPYRALMQEWLPGFAERPKRRRKRRTVTPPAKIPTPDETAPPEQAAAADEAAPPESS
jgi:hypothetical protein